MTPWYIGLLLVRPARVRENLARACDAIGQPRPNDWQLCVGVLRLWHRVVFRSDTVGTSAGRVRATLRARLLAWRALRLPSLLVEGAVVPLDFSGLGSSPERLIRHLLGAHHDRNQFVYDLELLAAYGMLDTLREEAARVVGADTPRSRWLRDLAVYDGYHESLLAAVERAIASGPEMTAEEARDPDISLRAYLAWCARQPATPAETLAAWRAGTFAFDSPLDPPRRADPVTPAALRARPRAELARLWASGQPFDPAAIDGWIYRGTSLGLPAWVERVTWVKFAKAFQRAPGDGRVRGWNVRIEQDGLDRPWRPVVRGGRPVEFGPFVVERGPAGVVLDYRAGGGALRPLRDPLVALDDRADRLLGRSLVEVAGVTVPTPSYFLLERDRPLEG